MAIACTLPSGEIPARRALIESLRPLERVVTTTGMRVRLRDTPEIDRRVRELIAAEFRCCPFLGFALRHAGGELVLDVTGPADARPVIETFFG
jgi:hypothetical protein